MKRHFSKTGRGLLGLALAAAVLAGVGGGAAADAASKSNPADYSMGVSPQKNVSYTPETLKEESGKAKIRLAYLYNQTDGTVYLRVVHANTLTYATEYETVGKMSRYTGTNPIALAYISTNTTNKYKLRTCVENATVGYTAGVGSWWP